jgi:hypothetical protein
VLVGVDVGQFHKWCEQNGYLWKGRAVR